MSPFGIMATSDSKATASNFHAIYPVIVSRFKESYRLIRKSVRVMGTIKL